MINLLQVFVLGEKHENLTFISQFSMHGSDFPHCRVAACLVLDVFPNCTVFRSVPEAFYDAASTVLGK